MLLVYVILLIGSLLFGMLDMLKAVHFRGYAVPARICYALFLLTLIIIAMKSWYVSSFLTLVMIVMALVIIGLLETGFRNKLQNRLSGRFIGVISLAFIIDLVLVSCLAVM